MTNKKNEESIKIKKKTLILAAVVILAIFVALTSFYYLNTKKGTSTNDSNVTTEEVLSMEPVELIATAIIAKECIICLNMSQVMQELKQTPFIILTQSNIIQASSDEAKALIKEYNINKLPTIILQGDRISDLPLKGFKQIENTAILEDIPLPYVNLATKNLVGLVGITYITDNSCKECYDVKQHKDIMEMAFGVYIANEKTIDVNSAEGAVILQKYNITKVPTILLTADAKEYPTIQEVWDQIGTVESDGTYVFRGFEMTQALIYKDLSTGELINTSQIPNEE